MSAKAAALLVVALAACSSRPSPLVLCHNSNCVGPDTEHDDDLPTLQKSLAQMYDGVPALDGLEIDTFWWGAESRCLYAHDLSHGTDVSTNDAAAAIASYLAANDRVTFTGGRFHMLMELKPNVAESFTDAHSPEQYVQHATCLLDAIDIILAGARMKGHEMTFGVLTSDPEGLRVLAADPRWSALGAEPDVETMLIADIFAPYSSVVPHLSEFDNVALDAVEFHPDFMTVSKREAYRSLGLDLIEWSYVPTSETFDAIEKWEPPYVLTNDALLMRKWIDD
ncbi:MAG TPA: hypothetical protein VL326_05710 [Kofleriaceae bacterium]|nr:hypothetical protein [Kofleriaceae bacterium]